MCKVSSQHTQSKLEKLLEDFIKSDCCLLFLTASMQDVTEKMVNHLRVIIEEAESQIKNTDKLFVLLLHFPPAMFFNPCYSSLFLQGWDHHYLDSISPATLTRGAEVKTVVDINEWFQQCCCSGTPNHDNDTPNPDNGTPNPDNGTPNPDNGTPNLDNGTPNPDNDTPNPDNGTPNPDNDTPNPDNDTPIPDNGTPNPDNDKMVTALKCLLEDAIPVIASRLILKVGKCPSFSGSTNSSQRTSTIKDLLLNKGIGNVLSQQFAKYWNSKTMLELLQKVSTFTYSRKSTLNITDAVQTTFRSLFFDFLVYMFAKMNADHNIDILLDEHCTPHTLEHFLRLLHTVPVPDLNSLQDLSANVILQVPKESNNLPKFPFFKYVCEAVDKCIDETREKVYQGALPTLLQGNTDQLQGYLEASIVMTETSTHRSTIEVHKSKQLLEELYCEVVKSRIKVCMMKSRMCHS